jgi:hypothetical protein
MVLTINIDKQNRRNADVVTELPEKKTEVSALEAVTQTSCR